VLSHPRSLSDPARREQAERESKRGYLHAQELTCYEVEHSMTDSRCPHPLKGTE
jgi:hypothetical protein